MRAATSKLVPRKKTPQTNASKNEGTRSTDCSLLSNNDFFKMGAVVAIGELYDNGKLGNKKDVAAEVRDFLQSFGIHSIKDMKMLGMSDHYLSDFKNVYPKDV